MAKDYTAPAIFTLAFLVVGGLVLGFMQSGKPARERVREPLYLSDEKKEEYTPQRVKREVRVNVHTESGDFPVYIEDYEDADPYEIEDAIEELKRKNQELRDILNKYGNQLDKKLEEEEFWSTKNR